MEWNRIRPAWMTRAESPGLSVEVREGADWDAVGWPSNTADPALEMSVFQSREFLETWMATIGRDRAVRPVLAVVSDADARPVLYLPFVIETRLGVNLLRFMDAGVSDLNVPIMARGRHLTETEFAASVEEDQVASSAGRRHRPAQDAGPSQRPAQSADLLPCASGEVYGNAVATLAPAGDPRAGARRADAQEAAPPVSTPRRARADPVREQSGEGELPRWSMVCSTSSACNTCVRAAAIFSKRRASAPSISRWRRRTGSAGSAHLRPDVRRGDRLGTSRLHRSRPLLLRDACLRYPLSGHWPRDISCSTT